METPLMTAISAGRMQSADWLIRRGADVNVSNSGARPGVHRTTCGTGHWNCGVSEPAEVNLKRPGIEYFRHESASSLVYREEAARKLRRV